MHADIIMHIAYATALPLAFSFGGGEGDGGGGGGSSAVLWYFRDTPVYTYQIHTHTYHTHPLQRTKESTPLSDKSTDD